MATTAPTPALTLINHTVVVFLRDVGTGSTPETETHHKVIKKGE